MNYHELKEKHRKELDAFPMAFAFSQDQLREGLEKLGVEKTNVISIGGGGFIRKTDKQAFLDLFDRHAQERDEALKDDEFVLEAIRYELVNHEYCISYDPEPALRAVGVSLDDTRVSRLFAIAKKKYWADYYGDEQA